MLIERAAGLSARIAQYNQLKGTSEEAGHFETRASQFMDVSTKLERTRNLLAILQKAGVPVAFTPVDGATLTERARNLRAAVQANPHTLADPPFNLKYEFTARLLAIYEAADKAMLEAWRAYVSTQAGRYPEDVLNALAPINQFKPIVARMRQCGAEIATLASTIPADPQASVARLRTLVASYRAAWDEMTADGIPDSVVVFLKTCAAEGAPLSSLTEDVHKWLAQRNLLPVFRIRI